MISHCYFCSLARAHGLALVRAHGPALARAHCPAMSLDWKLCVICQTEELRCPTRSADVKRPPLGIYSAFLKNVEEFQKLDALPVRINFGDQGTAQHFMSNHASWHKRCQEMCDSEMHVKISGGVDLVAIEGIGNAC